MSEHCIRHIENIWKEKTISANDLLNKGMFKDALLLYYESLSRAEILNNNRDACLNYNIPFIKVFMISCNNIANTCEDLNKIKESEKMLKRAVCFLLYLYSLNKSHNKNYFQVVNDLKLAVTNYNLFCDKYKKPDKKLWQNTIQEYIKK